MGIIGAFVEADATDDGELYYAAMEQAQNVVADTAAPAVRVDAMPILADIVEAVDKHDRDLWRNAMGRARAVVQLQPG